MDSTFDGCACCFLICSCGFLDCREDPERRKKRLAKTKKAR
jgi:hypothetical protein